MINQWLKEVAMDDNVGKWPTNEVKIVDFDFF